MKKNIKITPKKLSISVSKKKLYEKDFYGWVENQAKFLKIGDFKQLDLENLIEEIESLGRSEKRTLKSYLKCLLTHMLKIKFQPEKHTKSWDLSVKNAKIEAKECVKENPSLKPQLENIFKSAYQNARINAALETGLDEKKFPKKCPWTIEEILK